MNNKLLDEDFNEDFHLLSDKQYGERMERVSLPESSNESGSIDAEQVPSRCSPFDGNAEAVGVAWNNAARGFLIMGSVFLATALLSLAEKDAGCEDLAAGEECTGRTHGIRPSSLLTLLGAITGFISAILQPIVGAIVDHTQYRRAILICASLTLVANNYIQACVGENTWFFVTILQGLGPLTFMSQSVVLFAYIPDITDDSALQAKYNANIDAFRALSMIFTVISVSMLSRVIPAIGEIGTLKYEVNTARLSQIWSTSFAFIFFLISFRYMKPRSALSDVPRGGSLLSASFSKLGKTIKTIKNHYPALSWFCVSLVLIESVGGSFYTVAITYMVDFLGMSTHEISSCFLIFLLSAIIGAKTLPMLSRRLGLLLTLKITSATWMTLNLITAFVVRGPEQSSFMFPFSVCWGYLSGSVMPNTRLIYIEMIPRGQETEMMGFYFFCGRGFTWIPPLVFTIMNEAGIRSNWGLATMSFWFAVGCCTLQMMGSFESAVEHSRKMDPSLNKKILGNDHEKLNNTSIDMSKL